MRPNHSSLCLLPMHRRLRTLLPAGDAAVAEIAKPLGKGSEDQALLARIQARVGMHLPLVAEPLLPPHAVCLYIVFTILLTRCPSCTPPHLLFDFVNDSM